MSFFLAIAALDADVLSIENSKSDAKLLKVFIDEAYPRHIGPGVYDIHSPRVPAEAEFIQRIEEMLEFRKCPRGCCIGKEGGTNTIQSAPSSSGSTPTAVSRPASGMRSRVPSPAWSRPPSTSARSMPTRPNFAPTAHEASPAGDALCSSGFFSTAFSILGVL